MVGLFFWLLLRVWKVPGTLDLKTDEKLLFSLLVSVAVMGLAFLLRRLLPFRFLGYFDLSSDVSLGKLFALAVAGSGLGLVVGWR